MRVGYVPYHESLTPPGDYRRFVGYANYRNIPFEIAKVGEKYDLVVLSSRADITTWCDYDHGVVVFDFINSYLDIPYTDIKGCLRGTAKFVSGQHAKWQPSYWGSLHRMCDRADAVICTTTKQTEMVRPYCHNTHIVLDMHDSVVSSSKSSYAISSPIKLVWEGLPENIVQFREIQEVLRTIDSEFQIELNFVTDLWGYKFLGKYGKVKSVDKAAGIVKRVNVLAWDKLTWSDIITQCDLALIPIDLQNPIDAGKPENKLLLFWRMGIPVITSATPAYSEAMNAAKSPYACTTDEDWYRSLKLLIEDENLRRDAGHSGKKYVESNFAKEDLVTKWDQVFRSVGFDFSKPDTNQLEETGV